MWFPAVTEADSVVKVAEWQQTYYASDSGIQSGATTVQDDENSTEYSGRKKYNGSTATSCTAAPAAATTGGGGDAAAGGLESPTGESLFVSSVHVIWLCSLLPNLRHSQEGALTVIVSLTVHPPVSDVLRECAYTIDLCTLSPLICFCPKFLYE